MLRLLQEQQERARSLLPPDVLHYYAAGAGDELTVEESAAAWQQYRLRPRPLRDVTTVDQTTELLGLALRTPIGVAPTAFHRLAHEEAEVATARGAGAAGALMVVSTRATLPLEDIAAGAAGPWWFQVYVMRDRDVTARLAERAAACGAQALVLTGDTPYVGRKNGVDGVRIALPDDQYLVNIARHLSPGADGRAAAAQDPSTGLETIGWLRALTGLPVVVKGVLRGDSALECVAAGAAGLVVSNHGGRQLDRSVPSALALAEVCDAVAARVPVLVDSGIRTGLDIYTALALGARAVLVGRPVIWALAAGGSAGVESALVALRDDLAHVMALAGTPSLRDIDRSMVVGSECPGCFPPSVR